MRNVDAFSPEALSPCRNKNAAKLKYTSRRKEIVTTSTQKLSTKCSKVSELHENGAEWWYFRFRQSPYAPCPEWIASNLFLLNTTALIQLLRNI
jgi:hypothetical protein